MTNRRRTLHMIAGGLAVASASLLVPKAYAKGNLAHDPVHLPELKINTVDLKYSETNYQLETGKFYWWTVSSDGEEENIGLAAPELFAASWVYQVTSGEDNVNEVHTQSLQSIEFDGAGSQTIQFIPIQPGEYDFYTPGYENKGLRGTVRVD